MSESANGSYCAMTVKLPSSMKLSRRIQDLGVSTKTPLNLVQKKIGLAWFAIGKHTPIFISKISDANKMHLF